MAAMRRFLFLMILLTMTGRERAVADGMVFRPVPVAEDPFIPDQRALLHWMDGEETLVIETSVNGGGGQELAWVVPLPSVPEVEEAPTGLCPMLAESFGPEIRMERPWWFPLLVLPALRWWSKRTRHGFAFRLMVVGLLWGGTLAVASLLQRTDVFFAVMTLLAAPAAILTGPPDLFVTEAGKLRLSVCLAAVSLLMAALGILGAFSYGNIMAGGGGPVSVLGITQAGRFEVTVLKSEDPGALAGWMRENGYHLPPETRPAIEAYVREGWVFSAMKTRREGERSSGPLHPVTFRFRTDKPVYPMRLTAAATAGKPLTLDLFVLGPETAAAPGMSVRRAALTYPDGMTGKPAAGGEERGRSLGGAPGEIRRWFGEAKAGTWLRGVFPVSELSRDIVPLWTGRTFHDPEVTTLTGAAHAVMNRLTSVLLGLWIAARLHRAWTLRQKNWEPGDPRLEAIRPLWWSLAAVGVVWSLAWAAFQDTVTVRQGSRREAMLSRYEGRVLDGVRKRASGLMEEIRQREADGNPMTGEEQEQLTRTFLSEMNRANNSSGFPVGESTVLSREGSRGTEIWYQSATAGRVHLVTWDRSGKPDPRPGRISVLELPR